MGISVLDTRALSSIARDSHYVFTNIFTFFVVRQHPKTRPSTARGRDWKQLDKGGGGEVWAG